MMHFRRFISAWDMRRYAKSYAGHAHVCIFLYKVPVSKIYVNNVYNDILSSFILFQGNKFLNKILLRFMVFLFPPNLFHVK